MDENFKCIVLIFASFAVYGYNVICGGFSPLSENYMTCLIYASNFHENLLTSFCNGYSPDLNVWNQDHKGCNRICTIKSENLTCSDTDEVKSVFQFDINLPVNVFFTGTCKSCFNITEITITCKLNITNMQSESHSTQNLEITTAEMKSRSSGDKTELIVAAGFCGAVIGALITIGTWMLQRKLAIDKMWKRRSTVQNPTNNDSPRSSNPQPESAVSLENQYLDIVPQNNQSYTPKEDGTIYNHLNEKPENTEDTDSPYDHAQYQKNQLDTILDSDYMHINKL